MNVSFKTIQNDSSNIYSLLLVAGYLKATKKELQSDGSWLCQVSIPNKEIKVVYKEEVLSHLFEIGAIKRSTANRILESLYSLDFDSFQKCLEDYLSKSISFYDSSYESFYHGLMIGLISILDDKYYITSNRESGNGRYDICLKPKVKDIPVVIMELKSIKGVDEVKLEELSRQALNQIEEKKYGIELSDDGLVIKMGIAFSGKIVRITANR